MFRRSAAAAALTAAGLVAAAPLASAAEAAPSAPAPATGDHSGSGNVSVLPVNACGIGVPILSGILDSPDTACD